MRKLTIEQIRSLVLSAADLSREADFGILTHVLEMALAELAGLGRMRETENRPRRTLIPVSEDRSPDVIGSWNWDIVNKVVYADRDVALIYNVARSRREGHSTGRFR